MESKTNILVIDEDVVVRQAIARILHRFAGVHARLCADPEQGARLVEEIEPDLLMLNIQEVGSRGEALFRTLRRRHESLPIVVLTPKTEAGAAAGIKALREGAVEVVTKPEKDSAMLFSGYHLHKRIPPALNLAADRRDSPLAGRHPYRHEPSSASIASRPAHYRPPVRLVAIGGCTGGTQALHELVPDLPEDFPVPVVVVQHLPRYYTGELARSLAARSRITVQEAWNGARLKGGTVWIAPGGYHTELRREGSQTVIRLHRGPREHGARPSIDLLFRSAVNVYEGGVLGVLLSGWGRDGLEGGERIREAGGEVVAQDPASALAPALPELAYRSGLAEGVYPAAELADALVARTGKKGRGAAPSRAFRPAPLFMAR